MTKIFRRQLACVLLCDFTSVCRTHCVLQTGGVPQGVPEAYYSPAVAGNRQYIANATGRRPPGPANRRVNNHPDKELQFMSSGRRKYPRLGWFTCRGHAKNCLSTASTNIVTELHHCFFTFSYHRSIFLYIKQKHFSHRRQLWAGCVW